MGYLFIFICRLYRCLEILQGLGKPLDVSTVMIKVYAQSGLNEGLIGEKLIHQTLFRSSKEDLQPISPIGISNML